MYSRKYAHALLRVNYKIRSSKEGVACI